MSDEILHTSDPFSYSDFAQELYQTNIISDPWLEGQERFRLQPVLIPQELYARLCAAAESVGRVYDELARIVWEQPALLDEYFHLTPYQKLMWLASGGRWHGIARLDLFVLHDGSIRVCEMNSDTPSGEAETVVLNRVRHRHHPGTVNPNAGFEERFVGMVLDSYRAATGSDGSGADESGSDGAGADSEEKPAIAILYPTDLPEDLSMIALYREWFERRGHHVMLGSPYNLHPAASGGVAMFDTPVGALVRHYKTDWWGERLPAWNDEEDYDDPDPLDLPLRLLLDADAAGHLAVVNPFGAVMTQNKLTMAFLWNNAALFSPEAQEAIRAYFPPTHRLCDLDATALPKDEWVLKSDYGCEGDEVILGKFVDDAIWSASLAAAIPERWIVQGYFDAAPLEGDAIPNYGLYLIAGEAAGIFTRLSSHATDYSAVTAPTFVVPG